MAKIVTKTSEKTKDIVINLRIAASDLKAIDRGAKAAEMDRSAFIRDAALARAGNAARRRRVNDATVAVIELESRG